MSRGDAPLSGALVLKLTTESGGGQGGVKAFESIEGRKTPGAKITLFTECLIYIDTFIVHCFKKVKKTCHSPFVDRLLF